MADGAEDNAPETSQEEVHRTVETRASSILEPLIIQGAGASEQPLFQKGIPPATGLSLDKATSERLELQSITGLSDSLSSMGSRNSSGRSRLSSGISRDGSVANTLASSSRTPKPPDLSIKPEKAAGKSKPVSPLVRSPNQLSHLPSISTSRVSSPLAVHSGKDLKLPVLGADTRCQSTVSLESPQSGHQRPVEDAHSCVSPVPTPYPDHDDGLDSKKSLEYQQIVDRVLRSKVDVHCTWVSNTFRLYVSSTFTGKESLFSRYTSLIHVLY